MAGRGALQHSNLSLPQGSPGCTSQPSFLNSPKAMQLNPNRFLSPAERCMDPSTTSAPILSRRPQGRLPQLRTVRSRAQHSLGVLDAPAGSVCVVFMHVVGAMSLMDWRPELAHEALAMFRDHVTTELIKHQGYLVRGCLAV